jgi:hypothetical protein
MKKLMMTSEEYYSRDKTFESKEPMGCLVPALILFVLLILVFGCYAQREYCYQCQDKTITTKISKDLVCSDTITYLPHTVCDIDRDDMLLYQRFGNNESGGVVGGDTIIVKRMRHCMKLTCIKNN